jgi:hypothetical protein
LRFLSQLLETAGLSIVISRRTLLHLPATSGGTYTFKQAKAGQQGEYKTIPLVIGSNKPLAAIRERL